MDLIADIGATNSRCALIDDAGRIGAVRRFLNADYERLDDVLGEFLGQESGSSRPRRGALAIAAPLAGDEVAMTNIGWRFRRSELERAIGLDELVLLNDFEALAHALPQLGAADCHRVGGGQALPGAPLAVLGPGSGLGVAALVPHASGFTAVAGEGGHVSLPALDETEAALVAAHGDPDGHCSAERLLSGPGLVNIHATLTGLAGRPAEALTPAEVASRAGTGEPIASQSFDVFFAMLGTVAGNLALTVGARGGVFIGGGIVPRVLEAFERSRFRERFTGKGRYRAYLDAIPTAVITRENPALVGLAAVLGRR